MTDPFSTDTRVQDREVARGLLTAKIARERKFLVDPHGFSRIATSFIIEDAEWRLRWLDCAPEGAKFGLAPMQDKQGVPMGMCRNENVGPCKALREARAARGIDPIRGRAVCAECGGSIAAGDAFPLDGLNLGGSEGDVVCGACAELILGADPLE